LDQDLFDRSYFMPWYAIFAFGALGGICPSLSKLAASFYANPEQPLPVIGTYVAFGLFALLGAIIAAGFGAKETRAAIVAGIAAPAIVTNVLSGATENKIGADELAAFYLITPAYAQISTDTGLANASMAQGIINVVPAIKGGGNASSATVKYSWATENGDTVEWPNDPTISLASPSTLAVPEGATQIVVNGQAIAISELQANDNTLMLQVNTAPTFVGDLRWALGGQRRFVIESVDIAR